MIEVLTGADRDPDRKHQAHHALVSHPWCWPVDDTLRRAAEELVGGPPAEVRRCGVLAVAAKAGGATGSLWALRPLSGDRSETYLLPLKGEALRAQRLAERLALRDLPVLVGAKPALRPITWGAEFVWQEKTAEEDVCLDGPSYGAALVLAHAALLLDHVSLPTDLVATAALDESGALAPVEGLEAKLRVVARAALGVRRVVVAKSQLEAARAAAGACGVGGRLEVVGCAGTGELLEVAFPGLGDHAPKAWRDPQRARDAARHLFRLCLLGDQPILGWGKLVRGAEQLLACLPAGVPERTLVEFSRSVAARHDDRPALLPWPDPVTLEAMPAVVQQFHVAHVLQSATDAEDAVLEDYLGRALSRVAHAPSEDHEGDLRVRGAVGRALARLRRWQEASEMLRMAVRGWFDIFHGHEASLAICELLRVRGIVGDLTEVRALAAVAARGRAEPACHEVSAAYLQVALGRALVQVGAPEEAVELLDPRDFALSPDHVRDAALRWRARAYVALGDNGAASRDRETLHTTSPGSVQTLLAALDLARAGPDAAAVEAALQAVAGKDPTKVRLLSQGTGGVPELARRVADEYPY